MVYQFLLHVLGHTFQLLLLAALCYIIRYHPVIKHGQLDAGPIPLLEMVDPAESNTQPAMLDITLVKPPPKWNPRDQEIC